MGQVGWWSRQLTQVQDFLEEAMFLSLEEATVLWVLLSTLETASSVLFWGRCTMQEGGGRH